MAGPIRITVLTNAAQAKRDLDGTAKSVGGLGSKIGGAGRKAGSLLGSALKTGAKVGFAGAAGLVGVALTKGFQRLNQIDQAKAKLKGLGNSTATVAKVMANSLTAVKGTAFGLGDASTVAAGAIASGVKPGKDLTRTLKLVADSATIGGTSLGEMGAIFNKVAATGKVQGDVLAQLGDRGIPILQLLAKQLHTTPAEVSKLASKGKIDFATFQKAMQAGLGGAALKSGNTFSGALANVGASLGRIGAGFLGGVFPHLAPAFQGITKALAPLEGQSKGVGDAIGKILGPALEGIGPLITRVIGALSKVDLAGIVSKARGLSSSFSAPASSGGTFASIAASLKSVGGALAGIDFVKLGQGLGKGAADTVSVFSVAIGFLANHTGLLAKALPALVVAFAAYKTAQAAASVAALAHLPVTLANAGANLVLASSNRALAAALLTSNASTEASTVVQTQSKIATIASTVATKAAAIGARAFAIAQGALNAVMALNPITLVVIAIVALVAAFVIAYKKSETFRNIVNGAMTAVKNVFVASVAVIRAVVKAAFSFVVGVIRLELAIAKAVVTRALNVVKAVFHFVFGVLPGIVKSKLGEVLGFVKSLPSKIRGALGDLGGILKRAGLAIIKGLAHGITAGLHFVTGAIHGVLSAAGKLIPHSPAKEGPFSGKGWTLYSGLAIGNDLAKGITRSKSNVRAASLGLAKAAIPPTTSVDLRDQTSAAATSALNASVSRSQTLDIRLTAEQASDVQLGRTMQTRLDAYASSGGKGVRRP